MRDVPLQPAMQADRILLTFLLSLLLATFMDARLHPCLVLVAALINLWGGGLVPGAIAAVLAASATQVSAWAMSRPASIDLVEVLRIVALAVLALLSVGFTITRRKPLAARLGKARWDQTLVETTREGFWAFDCGWKTTFINDRMAEMLGYARHEILGGDFRDFLAGEPRVAHVSDLFRGDRDGPEQIELRFRRSDGSKLWATATARPTNAEDGTLAGMLLSVEDVTERKRAERERDKARQALEETEARLGRLVDSNIIGIITADLSGEILEANDAFLRMVDYTREDLERGKVRWSDMTPEDDHPLDRRATNELWASGACSPYEKHFLRKDGSRVPVLIGAAALERFPRTWIAFVLELTERKLVEHALKEAKDAAEAASKAKDEFLAMLSHELRTPLTPVLLMASALLEDPETPQEVRPLLELTRRNVELEATLIDDLLDITRINHGKLRLNREAVDAHALLHQALEICLGDIRAGDLRVRLQLLAGESHVLADPARLQQVFWNLIKNAVKFTPAGGHLEIRSYTRATRPGPEAGSTLVVEVRDTGLGIEPDLLPKLFDAFAQGDETARRRHGGLGLGLAISRSIVEAHGGHLEAMSAGKHQGSTFTLELATEAAPALGTGERPEAPPAPRAERSLKILLVEDNRETLRYLAWMLAEHRHQVSTADRIATALEAAEGEVFDLVISDLELPDGSGLELMRQLGGGATLPGIALSGFGSEEDIELSKDAGFAEHLTKPVDFPRLEATIARVASAASGGRRTCPLGATSVP